MDKIRRVLTVRLLFWARSWNTEKPAALPRPCEDTARAFTLWCVV